MTDRTDSHPYGERGLSQEQLESRLLVESDGLVAVDKPWGLPSTGRSLDDPDCLQFAMIKRYGGMVWAVHQLDADTSGVNLFVRRKEQVAPWKQRLGFPRAVKTYLAVVHGCVSFVDRRVDAPIGFVGQEAQRCLGIQASGKRAVSEVHLLAHGEESSLLRVRIETGRTHQIRIHLASLGHPLVGEDWYDAPAPRLHPRQALHAHRIDFSDSQEPVSIESPLPEDLRELLERLSLGY